MAASRENGEPLNGESIEPEKNGEHRAEGGAGGDAERIGCGKRIRKERLKGGARGGKSRSGNKGKENAREPHVPDDARGWGLRFRMQESLERIGGRQAVPARKERKEGRREGKQNEGREREPEVPRALLGIQKRSGAVVSRLASPHRLLRTDAEAFSALPASCSKTALASSSVNVMPKPVL